MARLKRLVVSCSIVVGLLFAGPAHAAYDVTYWDNWIQAGSGWTSNWDIPYNRWFCNSITRPPSTWGLVTFIDNTGYDWYRTVETFGSHTLACLYGEEPKYTKVCHCKNTHWTSYWATCIGRRDGF